MSDSTSSTNSASQLKSSVGSLKLLPILVFAIALGVRLIGISWGLKNDLHNQSYHPDEGDIFSYSQAIEPAHLKFTPGFYNYGTLYLTTLKVASDMTAAYTGGIDPKNPDSVWSYVARCNMAGRIISAVAGAGTVLFVFLICRRLTNTLGSLAGAAVLAFAPAHVVHSRFQTVDIFALFLLTLSTYFALLLVPNEGEESPSEKSVLKWIVLAGVFAGLSAGTKYTGFLAVFTLLAVLVTARRAFLVKGALIGLASSIAAFVVATPGVVLDSDKFMKDFSYEMQHTSTGHGLIFEGTANGFVYHLANLFQGFGTIAFVLGFGALAYMAYQKRPWALAILAFWLPYYVLIGRAEAKFMRYTFPLTLGLSVGVGYAVGRGLDNKKGVGRVAVAAGILAVGGVDYSGLIGTVRETGYMINEDPRDSAARYLKATAASDAYMVGLPEDPWFWSPPLFKESTASRGGGKRGKAMRDQAMAEVVHPKVTYYMNPDGSPTQFDSRLLTDVKPDAVAISSFEYGDLARLKGRTDISDGAKGQVSQYQAFMTVLADQYVMDKAFGEDISATHDMMYIQPRVVIWKRKTSSN